MIVIHLAPVVQRMDNAIQWIALFVESTVIHWKLIYLAPVVQRVDNAIHWINCYPADKC